MMPADYTLLDATLEILFMLLVAFLLGWLFCWLMKKLFGRKQKDSIQYTTDTAPPDLNLQANRPKQRTGLSASSRERLYDPEVGIPRTDLDTDIDIPTIKEPAVHTPTPEIKSSRPRIDIPDLKTPDVELPDLDIKGKIDTGLDLDKGAIGKGLGAAAAGVGAIAVGAASLKDKALNEIDLPDIHTLELTTDVELSDVDLPDFTADVEFPDVDLPDFTTDIELPDLTADAILPGVELPEIDFPEVNMADLDAKIDLPDLDIDLPEVELPSAEIDIDDVEIPEPSLEINTPDISGTLETAVDNGKELFTKGLGVAVGGIGAVAAGAKTLKDKSVEKFDELSDDDLTHPDLPISKDSTIVTDDLTRITGIDESMATLLNNNGINTFKQLKDTDRYTLKALIEETDADMAIEPASWPHQAKLCADKNWIKLSEYQSFLSGESIDLTSARSGVSFDDAAKDDLKKIEGIGPFFESLLNKAGITTYEQLKNTQRDTLKEIIDAAGPDYRMHEPETWPYQAGLAERGDWKKLQDYIKFMTGRN